MRIARLCCPILLLATLLALLHLGDEQLTVPLQSWAALSAWTSDTPPAVMATALLRLAGIVLAGYLVAATTLAVAADAVGCAGLAGALLRAGLPRTLHRLITGTAGLGLAAGSVVLTNTASAGASPAVATVLAEEPPLLPTATMRLLGQEPSLTATMVLLDPEPPPVPSQPAPADSDDDWIVGPGDSFWSIAEELLTDRSTTPPDDVQIAQYCDDLIAANRSRLARPNHPELLFPGQLLATPPPP